MASAVWLEAAGAIRGGEFVEARLGVVEQPWLHEKGSLALPTRPGLGFEIDRSMLRRHGKRFFTASKLRVAITAVLERGLREARHLGAVRQKRLDAREVELAKIEAPAMGALAGLAPDGTTGHAPATHAYG